MRRAGAGIRRGGLALAMAAALVGCAAHQLPPSAAPAATPAGPSFAEWEADWLADLGAIDPRLALRMPVKPSPEAAQRMAAGAVIRGENEVGVVGGAIDLFSYEERERQLHELGLRLLKQPDDGTAASRRERVLLSRLLDGEVLRTSRERASPESASERVRAIVATWGQPASAAEVAERERLVERGLLGVIEDVSAGRLGGARVLELEDALDPLEYLAVPAGYPEATKVITTLRVALGKSRPQGTPRPAATSLSLAVQLETYLGVRDDCAKLIAELEEEEAVLRSDAASKLATLADPLARDALGRAAAHVHKEAACPSAAIGPGASPARAMHPPPERALVCDPLLLAAGVSAALDDIVATVVLHDDVAIALWALALDGGATDLDGTRTAHPLLASVAPSRQDRLVRAALVSPARAIAPGIAATLVDQDGPSERSNRATRWLAFGDAPFDLVAIYLKTRG